MADNRMFIRCRVCGETFYLGIYHEQFLGYSTYTQKSEKDTVEKLDKFFDKHTQCIIDNYGEYLCKKNKIEFDNLYEISYDYDSRESD